MIALCVSIIENERVIFRYLSGDWQSSIMNCKLIFSLIISTC